MSDYPHSLLEFQQRFPDERACADYLIETRWPDGFVCPSCSSQFDDLVLSASVLGYLMASHSNGISALLIWHLGASGHGHNLQ